MKIICKRQEDHGDMGMDINETWNAGMKDETRGTGTNGGVLLHSDLGGQQQSC